MDSIIKNYENSIPDRVEDAVSLYQYLNPRSECISKYNSYMKLIKDIRKKTRRAAISAGISTLDFNS